ncbi:restriction endonuclease subunit S [Pannonibacter sp. SL95]|uniref:restriction endonuclease subunit S n=1 Tax=Pannonibacter sp. SL95 TaxID=2995153 RepID=UPI002273D42F|nr:restriction endonuclease subunit S [Pannonibacter sp. SL95]MCY1706313.1 restriction endonuclease subunit S [Pannonibacter sp. SL95]
MSALPRGWVGATLDDFCDFENGDRGKNYSGRSTFVASGVPFISAGHLNNGHIDWEEMNYIPQTNYDRLGSGKVKSGDFLFCLRGSLGKHAFVPKIDAAAIASSLVIVRPSQLTDCKFVDYYFRSPLVKSSIEVYSNGVAQPNLSSANLGRFGFPLPPLAEQKRIVAKLDALNANSARARTEFARIETLVSRYKQAVLSKAFANSKGRTIVLAELISPEAPIRYGVLQPGTIRDAGVPLVRVCDLIDSRVSWAQLRKIEPSIDKQFANARIQNGDILLSVVGTIGRIALVEGMTEPTNIARAVARIRPNQNIVRPEWLALRLQASDCQESFSGDAREVARKTLNVSMVRTIKLALPTLEEQHEIVRRIESAFAKIDRLAKEAKRALELVGRLDEAILAKAFRGELVPQDESDEPAEHLLARIRAERDKAPKARRGRQARS